MPGKLTPEAAARRLQKKLKHDEDKKVRDAKHARTGTEIEDFERATMAYEDTWAKSADLREADFSAYAASHCT